MNKKKYEDLLNYFKRLVTLTMTFIAIITGISGYFFIKDRSDLKVYIEDLKRNAEESIGRIEESAAHETDQLRSEMRIVVEEEVRRELEKIFIDENISALVKEKVRREINLNAMEIIESEISKVTQEYEYRLSEIMEINDAALRMRIGHYEGYKKLMGLASNTRYLSNKPRAESLLNRIKNDYIFYFKNFDKIELKDESDVEYILKQFDIKNDESAIDNLVKYILEEHSLDNISIAIALLNQLEGTTFLPFQFEEIKDWNKNRH